MKTCIIKKNILRLFSSNKINLWLINGLINGYFNLSEYFNYPSRKEAISFLTQAIFDIAFTVLAFDIGIKEGLFSWKFDSTRESLRRKTIFFPLVCTGKYNMR